MTEEIKELHELIERKNKKLQEASEKLRAIGEIADGLASMSIAERRNTAIQMCRCAGFTIRDKSYCWADLDSESRLALPEAEQEQGGEINEFEF